MKVVIFGGTGFIGRYAVESILRDGYEVQIISRHTNTASIFLGPVTEPRQALSIGSFQEIATDNIHAVVNLAYCSGSDARSVLKDTRRLIDAIVQASTHLGRTGRLIHCSTHSVFGYRYEKGQYPGPIRSIHGDAYVRGKLLAEQLLSAYAERSGLPVHIVRLGNVLGPGSPGWVTDPARRILRGEPVAYSGRVGPSNGTLVRNAAAYLRFLVRQEPRESGSAVRYHHLSEPRSPGWGELFDVIAATLGRPWLTVASEPARPGNPVSPAVRSLARYAKRSAVGDELIRWLSTLSRSDVEARLRDRFGVRSNLVPPRLAPDKQRLLDYVANETRFAPVVDPGWDPPQSFEQGMEEIASWLRWAGFV